MVTFLRVPYASALKRGRSQDRILTELCEDVDRIDELDWAKAEKRIYEQLTPLESS